MSQIHDERALAGALHTLSDDAPDTDVDAAIRAAVGSGRRRVLVRRTIAATAATAAAAVVASLGFAIFVRSDAQVAPQPAARNSPTVAFDDVELTCGDASGVNEGTVDGADPQKSPTRGAEQWAAGSGFSTRYPHTAAQVLDGSETTIVIYRDRDGEPRAALKFDRGSGGWTLTQLRYC